MNRLLYSLTFVCLSTLPGLAQEFSGGFRAGINFSRFNAPLEMDSEGAELEEYTFSNGFHVGATANLKLTDIFGLRAELLYSQKGTEYTYNGQSFWRLNTEEEEIINATGTRSTVLSIKNSYIDVPLMAFARFGRFEISGGMTMGVLVASRGDGEVTFSGRTDRGSVVDPFTIALDFNYFDGPFQRTDINEVERREVDGKTVEIPKSLGSYYEGLDDTENLFNNLDLGLIGGVAVFLNQGLYVGLRLNYGLSDITKTERDIARRALGENGNFIFRDDDDNNVVLQASVGFSF